MIFGAAMLSKTEIAASTLALRRIIRYLPVNKPSQIASDAVLPRSATKYAANWADPVHDCLPKF
jgi:hypothetical protein